MILSILRSVGSVIAGLVVAFIPIVAALWIGISERRVGQLTVDPAVETEIGR